MAVLALPSAFNTSNARKSLGLGCNSPAAPNRERRKRGPSRGRCRGSPLRGCSRGTALFVRGSVLAVVGAGSRGSIFIIGGERSAWHDEIGAIEPRPFPQSRSHACPGKGRLNAKPLRFTCGVPGACCFDACHYCNPRENDSSDDDPVRGHVHQYRAVRQAANYDQVPNYVKSK